MMMVDVEGRLVDVELDTIAGVVDGPVDAVDFAMSSGGVDGGGPLPVEITDFF